MREDIEICDFTAGELSPRLKGRTDFKGYFSGCDTLLNMVVLPQGGTTRRPGTRLAGLAKDQSSGPFSARVKKFQFSTAQAYILEITNGNFRIYLDDGVALSGGVPVDIAVPYVTADIAALQFTQSADTLYITHNKYAPATLTRQSNTSWTYATIGFRDGPYLNVNTTTTTLSASGTSGSVTITASSVVGINVTPTSTGLGFQSTDVGRPIRIQLFSLWAWCIITAVTDTTHVTATVQGLVQNGAWQQIDGAPWAANTKYPTGAVVANTTNAVTNYYIALTGGVSGGGTGPDGTGSLIIDGTVTWSLAGPWNATAYNEHTIYACGNVIYSGGNYYECIQGGDTGANAFPGGTGTHIAVNGTLWDYIQPFSFPTTTTNWALGKWYTGNYPGFAMFWQSRLVLLSTPAEPSAVEGSVTDDFTNFAPTQSNGTVTAANALSWVIFDDQVNAVRWVQSAGSSVAMQLGIGTSGGEQIMQPATNSLALSSSNVQVYRETQIGSAPNVPAQRVGKSVLFANRSGRKLLDWIWQWAVNGFVAIDRTVNSEHITRSLPSSLQGIIATAYQQQPYGIVWCVRGDGALIGMTYLPEQNVIGWHRHQLGGGYNGGNAIVESIDVIPSPDGSYDELWLCVLRTTPSGALLRTIEVMTRFFDALPQEQSFFVDCGISSALNYPAANITFSGFVNSPFIGYAAGQSGTVTADASVFSFLNVGWVLRANGGSFLVTGASATKLTCTILTPPGSMAAAPFEGWSLTEKFNLFGGLSYLGGGANVQIIGDGADFGTQAVDIVGAVVLPNNATASYVSAGLPMFYQLVTMPWAPQRALPVPPSGKTKKIDHLYLRLLETLELTYAQLKTDPLTFAKSFAGEETLTLRGASGNLMGQPPALFTGIVRLPFLSSFDQEGQISLSGGGPYPCTVLSIAASADVGAS